MWKKSKNENAHFRDLAGEGLTDLSPTEHRMANENVRSLVLRYSIPTIIGMLVNALYNVVDRFWVGQMPEIGNNALTGLGLAMPLMNIAFGFAQLVGVGAAARISISLGRKDRVGAEQVLGNALSLSIVLSVFVTAFGLIFMEPILSLSGGSEATLPFALSYLRIVIGGCIFNTVSFCMNHPIRASGNPKRFASTQLLGGVANMVLDPIFIFGFHMGIEGAALATVIAQILAASWVFSYYFSKKADLRLRLKYLKPRLSVALSIFSIGLSPFLMQIAGSMIALLANWSLKHYGDIELANGDVAVGAFTVIMSVFTLFFMPMLGLNQGTQPIIGYNYGAKNYRRVREAYQWQVVYAVTISTLGLVIIQCFAPALVSAFNDNPDLVSVGSFGMRVFLCALPLIGFQVTTANYFQSVGRAVFSIILSLLRQVILLIPAYLILPTLLGLRGIWMAGPLSDTGAAIITTFFIAREFKRLKTLERQECGI